MNKTLARVLVTGAAAGGALLLVAGTAPAQVSVTAPGAQQGDYTVLTFRVPTESSSAGTTALTVELPNLLSARTEPMPGWTATVQRDPATETATSVTWTAHPGVSIEPGQFQQFVLYAGPLPEQDQVEFPTTQTYSDGTVVHWTQTPGPGGGEPDEPAPTLTLTTGTEDFDAQSRVDESTTAGETTGTSDSTARWLGGIGLVLGATGAALGAVAMIRSRRS
ncbi:YcnI family copper-binding membrane protein [Rhodococcus spongiicola]|uniref:DUF1775 domain-containing protein n=1 Tax=Rhodococcus spongiicola TaxID=2487352 RepID=A0A438AU90_9NOCA|nr:YcnI family protein [Rhodococcus spongiicola]RVW02288.1 DUF1775 domain-containing protein [Rhodococcus spongiicola]